MKIKYIKHLFSIVLVIVLVFSFNVFSYASNDTSIDLSNATINMHRGSVDYSSTVVNRKVTQVFGGQSYVFNEIYNTNSDYYKTGEVKYVVAISIGDLDLKTQYQVKFQFHMNANISYNLSMALTDNSSFNADVYSKDVNAVGVNSVDVKFTLDNSNVVTNNNLYLYLILTVPQNFSYNWHFFITDIEFKDLDDNSNFFDGIIGTVKHILIAIVGGECSDGDYSSVGLFGKLKEGLTNLGNKIGSFFTDLWDNKLKPFFGNVSDWFNQLIHGPDYDKPDDSSAVDSSGSISDELESADSDIDSALDGGLTSDKLKNAFSSGIFNIAELNQAFIALNNVFDTVVTSTGFTSLIVFVLGFSLAVYVIGRRLSG